MLKKHLILRLFSTDDVNLDVEFTIQSLGIEDKLEVLVKAAKTTNVCSVFVTVLLLLADANEEKSPLRLLVVYSLIQVLKQGILKGDIGAFWVLMRVLKRFSCDSINQSHSNLLLFWSFHFLLLLLLLDPCLRERRGTVVHHPAGGFDKVDDIKEFIFIQSIRPVLLDGTVLFH